MSNIKDVAKLAGVSPSTVSRVLSGSAYVEEGTKTKVLQAVQALQYTPDALARGLRKGRASTIGLMLPYKRGVFWPILIGDMEKAAKERGFSLVFGNSGASVESEMQMLRTLGAQSVSGIICTTSRIDVERYATFQKESGIPVVVVNRNTNGMISSVSSDDEHMGYTMARYLLERGHRKIACLLGDSHWDKVRDRFQGVRKAMEEYGNQEYTPYLYFDVTDIDATRKWARQILERNDPPTAFLSLVDQMSIGIHRALQEKGMRAPQDVSMIGVDNDFVIDYVLPDLTAYRFPQERIAEKCVDVLVDNIQGNRETAQIKIKGNIVERSSVKDLTVAR